MMTKKTCIVLCLLALMLLGLAACGSEAVSADLQTVYDRFGQELELPEMITLADKKIQKNTGIDPAACPQIIVAQCLDGLRVDEIWLVEAADEAAAEEILALAEGRIERVCAETENYLPDQYAVAKQSRAVRVGNYVGLFLSPNAAEMEELFRKSF